MNYKLPTLTFGLLVGILVCFSSYLTAQPPISLDASNSAGTLTPENDPQQLVRDAAQEVFKLPSVEAKMRQRVNLLGQQLVGAGMYRQLGNSNIKLTRLELKMTVTDKVSSLVQVCDGERLWIRRDLPTGKSVGVVNLRQIEQAMKEQAERREPVSPLANSWMALGGLSKLLEGLAENFDFHSAKQTNWNGANVWQLQGRWKPDRLAKLLDTQADKIDWKRLPQNIPHQVSLLLARDPQFPLFPYRVEYYREEYNESEGAEVTLRPVVTMELFEVRQRADLDPRSFRYDAGNLDITDLTEVYLEKLD